MTTFETLDIGTPVFLPSVKRKEIEVECPDCHGAKTWHVYTGNRQSFNVPCPRCTRDGHEYDWLRPKRYETEIVITEATISDIIVKRGKLRYKSDDIETEIRYRVDTDRGHHHEYEWNKDLFLDRGLAEAKGQELFEADQAREKTEWEKELDRNKERARYTILNAMAMHYSGRRKEIEAKIEKLREKMLQAISEDDGPEITKNTYSAPHIASADLAEWLGELLSEADIEGWTEQELHEAMCHC